MNVRARDITVRRYTPSDAAAVDALLAGAFQGDSEVRLVHALRSDAGYVHKFEFVAVVGDVVVGHVLFTRCVVDGAEALCLAPLAVEPCWQRHGIGATLVERALARLRDSGERFVLVLGHPTYYPRLGFEPAGARGIDPPQDVPPEAWMVAPLVPEALDGVRGTARLLSPFDDPEYW